MNFNYPQICQGLLSDLTERQKEVICRRFGLEGREKETLEAIGRGWGISRERVRQIETAGFAKIKLKIKEYQKIFQYFINQLKQSGDLKKETLLLSHLGGEKYQNQVSFLLSLTKSFQRFSETKEFHSFWTINPNSFTLAKKTIDSFYNKLSEVKRPLSLRELKSLANSSLVSQFFQSFLEISKQIQKNEEGLFGLKNWPEINPRGVKDKAYLVFKKIKNPLHFREVAQMIGSEALPQTVHNELIKDPRFVLVGRGTYALKDWGYIEGDVKDVILRILEETQKPLPKEKILEEVLKQRLVKETTIFLNLNNKKYFQKNPQGEYFIVSET